MIKALAVSKKILTLAMNIALSVLDDACYLCGVWLVAAGASRIYAPAGLIAGGIGLIAYGLLIAAPPKVRRRRE